MKRNIQPVAAFAANGPFTENQIRWFIFCATNNGLAEAGAIVRVGRRVYIDTDRFDAWIDSQQPHEQAAAA